MVMTEIDAGKKKELKLPLVPSSPMQDRGLEMFRNNCAGDGSGLRGSGTAGIGTRKCKIDVKVLMKIRTKSSDMRKLF